MRYDLPFDEPVVRLHFLPFSLLFLLWVLVFFIAGLYEQHTLLFQKRLPYRLLRSIAANALIAVLLFYFFPAFLITPRANLFLYLIVSSLLLFFWRLYGFALFGMREKENALLIGSGTEFQELSAELSGNAHYGVRLVSSVSLPRQPETTAAIEETLNRATAAERISLVIADLRADALEALVPRLYTLLFSGVKFADMYKVYEELFGRVPLSLLRYHWFLENIPATKRRAYDFLKRAMDVAISLPLFVFSLMWYPLVTIAIKLDDGGEAFIAQERVGEKGRLIRTYKFRSMLRNEENPTTRVTNTVTRVGAFLRRTRLDELPQLWSVLRGEMSLIGPRPELPSLVSLYEREVPYYNIRHLIKPGLSGWAQIYHENHPHHQADVSETKVKLSYDLYYIKHRSLWLDFKIALKTVKILLSRSGV